MDLQTSGGLLQGYPAHRAPVGHLLDVGDYTAGKRFIVVHGSAVSLCLLKTQKTKKA
jgi:hypothetical protein